MDDGRIGASGDSTVLAIAHHRSLLSYTLHRSFQSRAYKHADATRRSDALVNVVRSAHAHAYALLE